MSDESLKRLRWRDALVAKVLAERDSPIISTYWIASKVFQLGMERAYEGQPLQLPAGQPGAVMLGEARKALLKRKVILQDKSLPSQLYRLPGETAPVPELMCSIDPFGHVAYLSAMAYHGLTNRLPKVLYFVSPHPPIWNDLAEEKMRRDLGDLYGPYTDSELPRLRRVKIEKLDGVVIKEIRTKEHRGGWRSANDGALRVTGLGKTFVDMLQHPDICGGIRHVIEVFQEQAPLHLKAIVAAFNTHGGPIDKVRAGYILETYCGIDSVEVGEWTAYASRGGSRKLNPQADYSPEFSAKWCLSINV
ncbi:hypothetical protein KWH01_21590 [Xanthomonas campestris pv. merremiae]|uniref:type IV toxin-antitoxin system AbiEi family antitoxin domain-containing protein n=1 Tax=Xanthomonas TaxID=338 RepID=UPI00037C1179|nr:MULTISPECIES: hypothetical protein [Xanthomonas]MBV6839739.1 hypothetical protein [Xanthomonas campestris pv. merremiae]MCC4627396.1 hypothetical protein [Xanthomonas campestris pv. nigromaculans]ASK98971.1 hypothetical protein XcvCFBP7112P_22380 [Xanthomonas citri pv. vignicola]MBV6800078.1 hypothetical protein [Xanthomonas campestris pv. obscurae]MBV6812220.1 hypothetical protein [Xanthomonas campestris pv. pennamericanum]